MKKSVSSFFYLWGACILVPLFIFFSSIILIYILFNKPISLLFSVSSTLTYNSTGTISDGYNDEILPEYTGEIKYPNYGVKFGNITIRSIDLIDCPVMQGDYNEQLAKGLGHFTGSYLPGEGSKIVLSGHRATYLRNLGKISSGDTIEFKTNYGIFTYEVKSTKITSMNDVSVIMPDESREYLVIYTCYPFDTIGYKSERFIVYADYISGPPINNKAGV